MLQIPYVSCSKCNMRLIQQPCKETANFKNKSPQLSHSKYFLQAHFFIENNPTIFHYGGNKSLNLKSRKVPLYLIVSFFSNSLIVKSGRLALSKMFCFNLWFFKSYLYNSNFGNTRANHLWRFACKFSCLKWFFYNFCKSCNQQFVSN